MHDPAYKRLFSHPRMVEELLHGFAAREWSGALDFTTLEKLPAEFVSEDLRARRGDAVWRVRLRDRPLHVLVLLEFQSTVERHMALRLLTYTGLLYQDLIRRSAPGSGGELPPVLPVVLYNGRSLWKAALELRETMARYQPAQRYFVLDVGRCAADDLPQGNLVSALVRLEQSRTDEELGSALDALVEQVRESSDSELERAFVEWIGQVLVPRHFGEEARALPPGTTLAETVQEWYAREREKGHRAGREEGQAELMRRMAARKFGADVAERLSGMLTGIPDPDRLAEVGEWLLECEHGDELLGRVERLCATSAPGDGPSRG